MCNPILPRRQFTPLVNIFYHVYLLVSFQLCRIFIIAHQHTVSSSIITHEDESTFASTQPIQSSPVSRWDRLQSHSPLTTNGSNFPGHGYQNDTFVVAATYTAGKTYQMALSGSVTHGGGSCQLSLYYGSGGTLKVIKSIIEDVH